MSKGALFYKGHPINIHKKSLQAKLSQHLQGAKVHGKDLVFKTPEQQSTGSYAYLFACAKHQTATDIDPQDHSLPPHGLFSILLLATLIDQPSIGIKEAVDEIAAGAKQAGFEQTPSIEASPGRELEPLIP